MKKITTFRVLFKTFQINSYIETFQCSRKKFILFLLFSAQYPFSKSFIYNVFY